MPFQFTGRAIDVLVAKGPRGGNFNLAIDGGAPTKIDLYRPPTDPSNPDNSGRKDLDFGVTIHRDVAPGTHTVRIDVLNDDPNPLRDMVYIDGFAIADGDIVTPTSVGTAETSSQVVGTATAGATSVLNLVVGTGTQHVETILEAADGVVMALRNAAGTLLGTAQGAGGVTLIDSGPLSVGTYTVLLTNTGAADAPFTLWEVETEAK
jgi:hypothetical protein